MREEKLQAVHKNKFKVTTKSNHKRTVAENHLARRFGAEAPNKAWATDISYVWTKEGWLYLCVIMDLFSRKIVGWSMGTTLANELVLNALKMARKQRGLPKGLILHSDRGIQYTSKDFQNILAKHGVICSMSRKGNCWDNAVLESFFGSLKVEVIYQNYYEARLQARRDIFEYIEAFYNRERLHSAIGYMTPEECELMRKCA